MCDERRVVGGKVLDGISTVDGHDLPTNAGQQQTDITTLRRRTYTMYIHMPAAVVKPQTDAVCRPRLKFTPRRHSDHFLLITAGSEVEARSHLYKPGRDIGV